MPGALTGCRAVVTGSSRGLGLAFARALGERGAQVVVNGVDEDRCAAAVAELADAGVDAIGVPGPVQEERVADELVAACVATYGGVDLVINNAGITRDSTLMKMTTADFDDVVAVHLRGAWAVSRAAARAMRAGGSGGQLLNVVSGSALFGLVGQSNYAAAKGGMLGLTRALSVELARHAIRVNALYPVALTDMTRPVAALAAERAAAGADAIPFGDPADVAPIACFLASRAAAHLTGQVIHFDGRELVVWSHPEPRAAARRDGRWDDGELAAFFGQDPSVLEPLHPDRWGAGTRGALATTAVPAG
jgi:3-oxoacyl-[acyl-carrier protein] reductase